MTIQKIHFIPSFDKAPLEIDVPAEIENKLRWAVQEFVSRRANLGGANLREADLREADLRGADLREADLRWANLGGADLREADLGGANLGGANLREADLREADLRGAKLGGADLGGADLIPLPIADGYCGWAWRESEGSPLMISYGCHYGERSLSLSDARAYWAGKENRREIYAALDYAEAIAKIKVWI